MLRLMQANSALAARIFVLTVVLVGLAPATSFGQMYSVGGSVSGLPSATSVGLELTYGAVSRTASFGDGPFTFETQLPDGMPYAVSVDRQPLRQYCVVRNRSGTISGSDVDNVEVSCRTTLNSVGGTVSGLSGEGLILRSNKDWRLSIDENGPYTFPTGFQDYSPYSVSVRRQPTNPSQNCTVENDSGLVYTSDISNVDINCVTRDFTIGGTVSGLLGDGLALLNNGTDRLAISADGSFTFPTPLEDLSGFEVTIDSQPGNPQQTCTVSNGQDSLSGSNVTDVQVSCVTDQFNVGGAVSGLAGSGLVLQVNGGNDLPVDPENGTGFAWSLDDGMDYQIDVAVQPTAPSQTCSVANPTGTVAGTDITDIRVDCLTDEFTVGGTVEGLAGSGLTLLNNGGDRLDIAADGSFVFDTALKDLSTYSVTVGSQPDIPQQTCTVSSGQGALSGADVSDVQVNCVTNRFSVGGTVSGLAGSGLVLQINEGDDLAIDPGDGTTFAWSLEDGSSYQVSVASQPTDPSQTCSVTRSSGTLNGTDVTNVLVECSTDTFTVGGTVDGLEGRGLVLSNNGTDELTVTGDGSFAFAVALEDLSDYDVSVASQPTDPVQACSADNASGRLDGKNVSDVRITCTTEPPGISLLSSRIDLGTVPLGDASTKTLTIESDGVNDLVIQRITQPDPPFAIVGGRCTSVPATLAPGESCDVVVEYAPERTNGEAAASFEIRSNAESSPNRVILRGFGEVLPVPALNPFGLLILIGLMGGVAITALSVRARTG